MHLRIVIAALFLVLAGPRLALAQIDDAAWGVTAAFTPRWRVPAFVEGRFDITSVNVTGRELRVGVVRGTTFGGEWGMSLVHKRLGETSAVTVAGADGTASFVTEDSELLGVEVHRFFPFARIGGRVQVGVNLAGGVAQVRGFVRGEYDPLSADAESFTALVRSRDVFEYTGRDVSWVPIAKVQVAVATLIGERAKVRVGGGLNLPGYELVNVSFSYLLGRDR
jgi:hypothetical protein